MLLKIDDELVEVYTSSIDDKSEKYKKSENIIISYYDSYINVTLIWNVKCDIWIIFQTIVHIVYCSPTIYGYILYDRIHKQRFFNDYPYDIN